jgi:hypothetical protein
LDLSIEIPEGDKLAQSSNARLPILLIVIVLVARSACNFKHPEKA